MKDIYTFATIFAIIIMLLYYPPILRGQDGALLAAVSNAILGIFAGVLYYGQRKELKELKGQDKQGRDAHQEEP